MARTTRPIYRIKAEHPGRPGMPLHVSDRAGNIIGVGGDVVPADLAPELLASLIDKGFVELVGPAPDSEGGQ